MPHAPATRHGCRPGGVRGRDHPPARRARRRRVAARRPAITAPPDRRPAPAPGRRRGLRSAPPRSNRPPPACRTTSADGPASGAARGRRGCPSAAAGASRGQRGPPSAPGRPRRPWPPRPTAATTSPAARRPGRQSQPERPEGGEQGSAEQQQGRRQTPPGALEIVAEGRQLGPHQILRGTAQRSGGGRPAEPLPSRAHLSGSGHGRPCAGGRPPAERRPGHAHPAPTWMLREMKEVSAPISSRTPMAMRCPPGRISSLTP